jgi:hypothetical protein
MAQTQTLKPVTEDAFLADRMRFWSSWTHFVTGATGAIILLLILMAIFLV